MPPFNIPDALQNALQFLQAGDLGQAEPLLRQILAQDPNQPDALHFLGIIAHQTGHGEAAVELIGRAIAVQPGNAVFYSNLAESLRVLGRLEQAEAASRQAVALSPNFASAYLNLGSTLTALRRHEEAIGVFRRAMELDPGSAAIYNNLGEALSGAGRNEEAIAAFRQALALNPHMASVHINLGSIACENGFLDEGVAAFQHALQLDPGNSSAYVNLANAHGILRHFDEAIALARRAVQLDPSSVDAAVMLAHILQAAGQYEEPLSILPAILEKRPKHARALLTLGDTYYRLGEMDRAIGCYRQGVAADPTDPGCAASLGLALQKTNQPAEAIQVLEGAIRRHPEHADCHFFLGMALLQAGQFADGWEHYEWRLRSDAYRGLDRLRPAPTWQGEDLSGKTILVHAEQGFGDSLQFIRYVPLLAERGAIVWLKCLREIEPLMKTVTGLARTFGWSETVPRCDYFVPLLSLPRLFHADLTNLPAEVPYLAPDPDRVAHWKERLSKFRIAKSRKTPFMVGLAWAGQPRNADDRIRSCALADFAPLAAVPGVVFLSLQKWPATEQIATAPFTVHNLMDEAIDFADSAALVANLDLVITVDTATAHLAGALARPVWNLLSCGGEWRWLRERTDNPWYPTMRLFRQQRLRDWGPVFQEVAAALGGAVDSKPRRAASRRKKKATGDDPGTPA